MIFDTFSFYARFNGTILKSRLDAVLSFGSHPYFEERRKTREQKQTKCRLAFPVGALIVNYRQADESQYKSNAKRVPKFALNCDGYLTGIYPINENGWCYGDIPHSNDLLVFYNQLETTNDGVVGGFLEMWVAPGRLKEKDIILQMLDDGLLDDELDAMRKKATPEPHPYINSEDSYQISNQDV